MGTPSLALKDPFSTGLDTDTKATGGYQAVGFFHLFSWK
jgi:hypothetical protein